MLKNLLKYFLPFYFVQKTSSNYFMRIRYHWLLKSNRFNFYVDTKEQIIYKELLSVDLSKILLSRENIPFDFICTGGTIDYKMIYLLSRILNEIKEISSIIEFGVGISSILLSKLTVNKRIKIISIEHDEFWLSKIKDEITSENCTFILAELKEYNNEKIKYNWYNHEKLEAILKNRYNLILVDGPTGSKYYSRYGINTIIEKICATNYIIIWDDLHRYGELQSFSKMIAVLKKINYDPDHIVFDGIKKIGLIYSKNYSFLKYYF